MLGDISVLKFKRNDLSSFYHLDYVEKENSIGFTVRW